MDYQLFSLTGYAKDLNVSLDNKSDSDSQYV